MAACATGVRGAACTAQQFFSGATVSSSYMQLQADRLKKRSFIISLEVYTAVEFAVLIRWPSKIAAIAAGCPRNSGSVRVTRQLKGNYT
jgi:hypothetical protein